MKPGDGEGSSVQVQLSTYKLGLKRQEVLGPEPSEKEDQTIHTSVQTPEGQL